MENIVEDTARGATFLYSFQLLENRLENLGSFPAPQNTGQFS